MKQAQALQKINDETTRARNIHGAFNSAHEGLAVIQEEFEGLKYEVFKPFEKRSLEKLRDETTQLAAMALKFIIDLT